MSMFIKFLKLISPHLFAELLHKCCRFNNIKYPLRCASVYWKLVGMTSENPLSYKFLKNFLYDSSQMNDHKQEAIGSLVQRQRGLYTVCIYTLLPFNPQGTLTPVFIVYPFGDKVCVS